MTAPVFNRRGRRGRVLRQAQDELMVSLSNHASFADWGLETGGSRLW